MPTPRHIFNYQPDCTFCKIVVHELPARIEFSDPNVLAFHPLNPVTEDHLLVIPKFHVSDFTDSPEVGQKAFCRAAIMAGRFQDANLIASKGPLATQSVFHLHFHIVPRRKGDGLKLPWSENA